MIYIISIRFIFIINNEAGITGWVYDLEESMKGAGGDGTVRGCFAGSAMAMV